MLNVGVVVYYYYNSENDDEVDVKWTLRLALEIGLANNIGMSHSVVTSRQNASNSSPLRGHQPANKRPTPPQPTVSWLSSVITCYSL